MTRQRESTAADKPADSATIAVIVDEYNNILTGISGYATLVSAELAPWNPCQKDLDEINVSIERAAEVTKRLAKLADDD